MPGPKKGGFRRTVRIVAVDHLDLQLIEHLQLLETISTFAMQEWMRSAMRRGLVAERLADLAGATHRCALAVVAGGWAGVEPGAAEESVVGKKDFKKTVRISAVDELDGVLISLLQRLEDRNSFPMQEWMRHAMRRALLEERIASMNNQLPDAQLKSAVVKWDKNMTHLGAGK